MGRLLVFVPFTRGMTTPRTDGTSSNERSNGRVLPFRTGDIALDCVLKWAIREHPELLVRWGTPVEPRDVAAPRLELAAHVDDSRTTGHLR